MYRLDKVGLDEGGEDMEGTRWASSWPSIFKAGRIFEEKDATQGEGGGAGETLEAPSASPHAATDDESEVSNNISVLPDVADVSSLSLCLLSTPKRFVRVVDSIRCIVILYRD